MALRVLGTGNVMVLICWEAIDGGKGDGQRLFAPACWVDRVQGRRVSLLAEGSGIKHAQQLLQADGAAS